MRFVDRHPIMKVRGAVIALARDLGITHSAVLQWKEVPAERVLDVERATGISRRSLRPDLYPQAYRVGEDSASTGQRRDYARKTKVPQGNTSGMVKRATDLPPA